MKQLHKKLPALIIPAILLFFFACSKKTVTVTNEVEFEHSLYGSWIYKNQAHSELWTGPNTSAEKYLGNLDVLNTNIITFSPNQEFTMQYISTIESLNVSDEASMTEEELRLKIEKNETVIGKFSVNKDYLELTSETVIVDNNTYSAEDYAKINSNFGSLVQTQKWALENNSLILFDLDGNKIAAFTKE